MQPPNMKLTERIQFLDKISFYVLKNLCSRSILSLTQLRRYSINLRVCSSCCVLQSLPLTHSSFFFFLNSCELLNTEQDLGYHITGFISLTHERNAWPLWPNFQEKKLRSRTQVYTYLQKCAKAKAQYSLGKNVNRKYNR